MWHASTTSRRRRLDVAPVRFEDGAHDDWDNPPRHTSYL
jgi:hypothetical protein